jgi:hypothetical protein
MQLSKHFSLAEFITSESAKRAGIDNMPPADHIENLKKLCENVLEPIRAHFNVPLNISSGYRCKALNRLIGGASNSQHAVGQAADIDMDGTTGGVNNKLVFNYIKDNLKFDQLIAEFGTEKNPDWVHVSFAPDGHQRNQILRGMKVNGKTVYAPYK